MILIKNGNVHNGLGQILENTDILVENGQISAIGKDIVNENAKIINAEGKTVFPGFIDARPGERRGGKDGRIVGRDRSGA